MLAFEILTVVFVTLFFGALIGGSERTPGR